MIGLTGTPDETARSTAVVRRIGRNSGFNILRGVAQFPVAVIIPPAVLAYQGVQEYGVWALLKTFAAYAVVIDLGMTRTVTKYTADAVAVGDHDRASRVIRCYFLLFVVPSLILLCLVAVMSGTIASAFTNGSEGLAERTAQMLTVTGMSVVVLVLAGLFRAFLNGLERMDVAGVLSTLVATVSISASFVALWTGAGLEGLVVADLSIAVLSCLLFVAAAKRLAPWLTLRPRRGDLKELRRVGTFNALTGIQVVVGIGHYQIDKLIVGAFLGVTSLAYYDLAYRLVSILATPFGAVVEAVVPSVSGLVARGETDTVRSVFVNVNSLAALLAAPLYAFTAAFAYNLLAVWTAGAGATGDAALAVRMLCCVFAIGSTTSAADAVLNGWGRLWPSVVSAVLTLVVGTSLSLTLVGTHQLFGVLVAAVIARFLGAGVFWALFARASWGWSSLRSALAGILTPLAVATLLAGFTVFSITRLGTPASNVLQLVVGFCVVASGYAAWLRLTGRDQTLRALATFSLPTRARRQA